MWNLRPGEDRQTVTCIACGEHVSRRNAREYDKYGDRWSRRGKEFEYFCNECDRDRCHRPRGTLESTLLTIEGTIDTRDEFLHTYLEAVTAASESNRESDG